MFLDINVTSVQETPVYGVQVGFGVGKSHEIDVMRTWNPK